MGQFYQYTLIQQPIQYRPLHTKYTPLEAGIKDQSLQSRLIGEGQGKGLCHSPYGAKKDVITVQEFPMFVQKILEFHCYTKHTTPDTCVDYVEISFGWYIFKMGSRLRQTCIPPLQSWQEINPHLAFPHSLQKRNQRIAC